MKPGTYHAMYVAFDGTTLTGSQITSTRYDNPKPHIEVLDNKLWMICDVSHPNDHPYALFYSSDGVNWTNSGINAFYRRHSDAPNTTTPRTTDFCLYNGKIYMWGKSVISSGNYGLIRVWDGSSMSNAPSPFDGETIEGGHGFGIRNIVYKNKLYFDSYGADNIYSFDETTFVSIYYHQYYTYFRWVASDNSRLYWGVSNSVSRAYDGSIITDLLGFPEWFKCAAGIWNGKLYVASNQNKIYSLEI